MKLLSIKSWLLVPLTLALLTLAGCDKVEDEAPPPSSAAKDPAWSEHVSAHTADMVSKTARVRVRFVNDVVGDDKVGQSAASVLATDPAIEGELTFTNKREILLIPSQPLESGRTYRAKVKTETLAGIPGELGDFEFSFKVIKQDFEINVTGLTSSPEDDNVLIVNGTAITADKEDEEKIEQLLSASYLDQTLTIDWAHNADGKHHEFSIKGIQRQEETAKVTLSWNGESIGVDSKGEHEVDVPAEGLFKVSRVRAVQSDRQFVQIEFSDKIDPRQNIKGLIQLSQPGFNTRIEENTIKVYPNKPLKGVVSITIEPGIKNTKGQRLTTRLQRNIAFTSEKPQVRFTGKGVILPENKFLSIPFEAVNVDTVQVTAFRVYENNIGQFLQSNKLGGAEELQRVGRYLWRKTINLKSPEPDKWNRYLLDATQLLNKHPGGLFRLTLSINRGNSTFSCAEDENTVPVAKEEPPKNNEDLNVEESSSWDYAEDYYGADSSNSSWQDRSNPCKNAYYKYASGVSSSRNFMASNIGIIAKRGSSGKVHVITTDLRTAEPLGKVKIQFRNFQNQQIGSAETAASGFAKASLPDTPFYLIAQKGKQKGYLKMNAGSALPTSHFDVGGEKVTKGIKGYIYGERGVWRPGDNIYLTFVLQDKNNLIPANHPVTMQLYNPKGQLMQSLTNTEPLGDFYTFTMKTKEDDLTGNWTSKAILGGSTFSKRLKIETVVPNRLKVELDFGKDALRQSDMPVKAKLFGQWLHGATAAGLKADVAVKMRSIPTRFNRFTDFVFDDPARKFQGESQILFEDELDDKGFAEFEKELWPGDGAPGMLKAQFTSRVFEESGAFSTSRSSIPYYPYENYVGIKLPKGDQTRGMLLTDTTHTMEIGSLDSHGDPVSLDKVQVTMYKVHWKWWWDKSGDSLAQYASASHNTKIKQETIATADGRGKWEFDIKYPEWGRYLIRACDLEGKHCTGKLLYIDWPGWAGRAQEESGAGASALTFAADKPRYNVGEVAKIKLPEATQGRALVSVENGSTIIEQHWMEFSKGNAQFDLPLTRDMSPNVYVNVSLIQPHQNKQNDRPIRLYGVIPIKVDDPATHLTPVVKAADEWVPESTVEVTVSEAKGQAMTYTLAVVDEGLLGLTSFKTPNPHKHFYKKEALGVTTWDLFDEVTGAYGGELERLLALGGGDGGDDEDKSEKKRRFPPVVKFLGPFKLKTNENRSHKIKLPQYVGAVRVMVVAGEQGAYGLADKSVFVRQSLNMLVTVPRVLGPEEELTIPVSLFVMEPSIKEVTLSLEADEHFTVLGEQTLKVNFSEPGEQMGFIKLKVKPEPGKGHLQFTAHSGKYVSKSEIYIDIRSPNPQTLRQWRKVIEPGDEWQETIVPHGLKNTNTVTLELSAVPPINLERRLQFLIRYPHGCVEQITSSVFPQLYLGQLVALEDKQKQDIEKNVHAAIERLRSFQNSSGGFMYWPGNGQLNAWATNYAGHFLLEAGKKGFHVPPDMLNNWLNHQQSTAKAWVAGSGRSELDQAYRLYTLALANQPELGAMNRLREANNLSSTARWQLAAAYSLAGINDAAKELVADDKFDIDDYLSEGVTFGSRLRDKAIILNSLVLLGQKEEAKDFADDLSKALSADKWHSTQSVAFSLLAMARFIGDESVNGAYTFEQRVGSGAMLAVTSSTPIHTAKLEKFPLSGEAVKVRNTSDRTLYASILVQGVPKAGTEKASANGLDLKVRYNDMQGDSVDVTKMNQSSDLVATLTVSNRTDRNIENVALTHILPSGWEIHNSRLDEGKPKQSSDIDYQDIRDDRVYTYFGLKPGEEKTFTTLLNATYLGRYYLPSVSVEAMYDASKQARIKGQWVEVIKKE